MKKSIVFDLDDTICFPNHNETDSFLKYSKATPNKEVIDKINLLYDKGFHVIINSARRMVTHNNDVEKVIEDIGVLTIEWLHYHKVKYHEILFGKPYSSTYYVDDKAMNIEDFLEKDVDEF